MRDSVGGRVWGSVREGAGRWGRVGEDQGRCGKVRTVAEGDVEGLASATKHNNTRTCRVRSRLRLISLPQDLRASSQRA